MIEATLEKLRRESAVGNSVRLTAEEIRELLAQMETPWQAGELPEKLARADATPAKPGRRGGRQ